MKKCAIYARVSTREQEERIDNQIYRLETRAKGDGMEIYDIYKDIASGSDRNRPELIRLLKDMRANRFKRIYIVRLDRITRSNAHLYSLMEQIQEKNTTLVAIDQDFGVNPDSPMGKAMIGLMGLMAELERDIISERVKDGLARARREGKIIGRPEIKVDDDDLIRRRERGESLREIAESLGVSKDTVRRRLKKGGS